MKGIASSENIEKFIQNDYIYIDKTEYIYNQIKNTREYSFKELSSLVYITEA